MQNNGRSVGLFWCVAAWLAISGLAHLALLLSSNEDSWVYIVGFLGVIAGGFAMWIGINTARRINRLDKDLDGLDNDPR